MRCGLRAVSLPVPHSRVSETDTRLGCSGHVPHGGWMAYRVAMEISNSSGGGIAPALRPSQRSRPWPVVAPWGVRFHMDARVSSPTVC